MDHAHHAPPRTRATMSPAVSGLDRITLAATLHCLLGCAIGEALGLAIGTALGLSNVATIALAVGLAFVSGLGLTALPLLRRGYPLRAAFRIALAADAVSIAIMEVVDNALMLVLPGAMDASVWSLGFWSSMVLSLAVAGLAAYPVNRWLIARGQGHAAAHAHHGAAARTGDA